MHRTRAQRVVTLLTALFVIGALTVVITPAVRSYHFGGRMSRQLSSARQIYLALRNYASDTGNDAAFPAYRDPENLADLATTSNQAFEILLPRYMDDKRPFFNRSSAWCDRRVGGAAFENRIYPGENDFVYVRGLSDKSPYRYPLLANAFVPGTLAYVENPGQPGGVWKGKDSVVVWADGSAEIAANQPVTHAGNTTYFIPRREDPAANAFKADDQWLLGENVEILYPEIPNAAAIPLEAVLGTDDGC